MRKMIVSVGVLGTAGAVPLRAQDYHFDLTFGGGVSAPLNPAGQYACVSERNSILGVLMWRFALHPINALSESANLYSGTANCRFHIDAIGGAGMGIYLIGGGGWHYRQTQISKDHVVPSFTVCQPIYFWWGYTCESGFVPTDHLPASSGSSAGGLNAGPGFTIRLSDIGWKSYVEACYHYA